MRIANRFLVVSAAVLLLVACGDDKTGAPAGRQIAYSGKTTLVTIDESNVGTVASSASEHASALAGARSDSITFLGAARSGAPTGYRKALALVSSARRTQAISPSGVVATQSQACDVGGTVTMTINDQDGDGATIAAGDYISLGFDNCSDGFETLNGSITLEFAATDGKSPLGDGLTDGYEYGMKLTMTNFVVESADGSYFGATGDMTLTVTWSAAARTLTFSIHGTSFAAESGVGATVTESVLLTGIPSVSTGYAIDTVEEYADAYATTLVAQQSGITGRVCSTELNGCVDVQVSPLLRRLINQLFPASGTIRITGAGGAWVEITATDGTTGAVTLSWDIDPAPPTPDQSVDTTWDCLANPACSN